MIRTAKRAALYLYDISQILTATVEYYVFGKYANNNKYQAAIRLHARTNARFTEWLANIYNKLEGIRPPQNVQSFLGELSIAKQAEIVSSIRENGFYVFPEALAKETCIELENLARTTPGSITSDNGDDLGTELYDENNPKGRTYHIRQERKLIENQDYQKIIADPGLLALAEQYIGSTPVLSGVIMWWTTFWGKEPGNSAAQLHHFDFDTPPKWLFFFIYLTDVGTENGPHAYVKGTHKPGIPETKELLSRGYVRIQDDELEKIFGKDSMKEFCGKRGTVLAVDTRGFHKGKPVFNGHRLITQISFALPVFSRNHSAVYKTNKYCPPQESQLKYLRKAADKSPKTYKFYLTGK